MASSVLVGEAAELDGEVSTGGTENRKVEPAAGLTFEGDTVPARPAYTVPKTNGWRLKKNDEMCMMYSYL